jgi:hypothetical protein
MSWAEEGFELGYKEEAGIWDTAGEYNIIDVPDCGVFATASGNGYPAG